MKMWKQISKVVAGAFCVWMFVSGIASAAKSAPQENIVQVAEVSQAPQAQAITEEKRSKDVQSAGEKSEKQLSRSQMSAKELMKEMAEDVSVIRPDDLVGTWISAEDFSVQFRGEGLQKFRKMLGENAGKAKSLEDVRTEAKKLLEKVPEDYKTKIVFTKQGDALYANYSIRPDDSFISVTSNAGGEHVDWIKAKESQINNGVPWFLYVEGLQRLVKDRKVQDGEVLLAPFNVCVPIQDDLKKITCMAAIYRIDEDGKLGSVERKRLIFLKKDDVNDFVVETMYAAMRKQIEKIIGSGKQ